MAYQDIIFSAGTFFIGLIIGLFVIGQKRINEQEILKKTEILLADARNKSKTFIDKANIDVIEQKRQFVQEEQEFVNRLNRAEQALAAKITMQHKREAKNIELQKSVATEEQFVRELKQHIDELSGVFFDKLIANAEISKQLAQDEVMTNYEKNFKEDAELRVQHEMEWTQECALREGRNMLCEAICRFSEGVVESGNHAVLTVSRDEIKGRIVGRGGSNIAFFENLFGVDVIFNDEPNTVIVDCFNLVQREIAAMALKRLMNEKQINESVIFKAKALAEQDVEKLLFKEGERILNILGVKNMPHDFIRMVGRLKFRTSYGQSIILHSFEVAYFARLLACELGANSQTAFIAGFFHDIGKAIDQEVGGSHDVLTKEILEKYNFAPEIIHAAWTHHNSAPQETLEARIIQIADAISASRPGARAESLDRYLAKIKDLEATAISFGGVKKAYAINAGREVRAVVDPEKTNDEETIKLALDIAAKVQEKGGYPGKIKVVTIRSTKVTNYAR